MADNENKKNEEKKEVKREKLGLIIDQPPQFDSLIQTHYTDSSQFCDEIVNPVFSAILKDYYGSRVEITQSGQIILSLFFTEPINKDESDARLSAIERIITKESLQDIDNRIKLVNRTLGAADRYRAQYKLTQDGMDILEDIIPNSVKQSNGKINWKGITSEGCFNNNMAYTGNNQVYVQVVVDMNKVIRTIYGSKDKNTGETYQYAVLVGNPINPVSLYGGGLMTKQWQLFIIRLSGSAIDKVARTYGMSGNNNMGIITV